MEWSEWRSSAGFAANMTSLAFKFAETFKGKPTPELLLEVKPTGGSDGAVSFSARVSEVANRVPAIGVHLIAELEGEGVVFEAQPFKLGAGELDHLVMFNLERSKYGMLVKACNDQQTLYGRTLTVTAVSDNGGAASASWTEDLHVPGSPRYEAMQEVWNRKADVTEPAPDDAMRQRLMREAREAYNKSHETPNEPDRSSYMG